MEIRAVHQPARLDPLVQPDLTQMPMGGSDCPYGLGVGELILKFGFTGWFRVL